MLNKVWIGHDSGFLFYSSGMATKPLSISSCSARVCLDDYNGHSWLDDSKSQSNGVAE